MKGYKVDWDAFQAGFYDFLGHVTINSKDEGRVKLEMYDAQRYMFDEMFEGLRNDIHNFAIGKGRQLGVCLDPETRVLTCDLRWVPMSELSVGQEIIAVDEHSTGPRCGRKMRVGIVQAIVRVRHFAYRISFDDGRSLICTGQHPWLSRRNQPDWAWRSIEKPFRDLNKGKSQGTLRPGTKIRWATRAPWGEPTAEDGWFGGMLDGEGHISNTNRSGVQISVSQRKGEVWDRLIAYCVDRGYHYWVQEDTKPVRPNKFGKIPVPQIELRRIDEAFRLIGQTRPTRFLSRRFWEDRELPGKRNAEKIGYATIVSIEPLGYRDLIDLQTSRGTYIAEGFVSHNTTALELFDVYYCGAVPDMQGSLLFQDETTRNAHRVKLDEMFKSLPESHQLPIAKGGNNRNGLRFENGNNLDYLIAGTKLGQSNFGIGRSYNYCHASEVALYGDADAFEAFRQTLSELYPFRCNTFESTGRGLNLFYDLIEEAKEDPLTWKFIFVGWWRKRSYSHRRGTALYKRYGWPAKTAEEKEAEEKVKAEFGHTITLEQWAWYRHTADPARIAEAEAETGEKQEVIAQEYPHHPDQMFRETGSPFILAKYITEAEKRANKIAFKGYRYHLGDNVTSVRIDPTNVVSRAHLRVWQEPSPTGVYIVAGDPAYGLSDKGDGFCCQVVRCYADKMVQVAEFCDRNITPYQFAWILLHLCGWYGNCRYILEINGPGEAVWAEFRRLKQDMEEGRLVPPRVNELDPTPEELEREQGIRRMFQHIRTYLYRRADAISAYPTGYHMKTSLESKFTFMTQFSDRFILGEFEINSVPCLKEMGRLRKDGRSIEADGKAKDDRPITLGLATRSYIDYERKTLVADNKTFEREQRIAEGGGESVIATYMSSIIASQIQQKRRQRALAGRRRGWSW